MCRFREGRLTDDEFGTLVPTYPTNPSGMVGSTPSPSPGDVQTAATRWRHDEHGHEGEEQVA